MSTTRFSLFLIADLVATTALGCTPLTVNGYGPLYPDEQPTIESNAFASNASTGGDWYERAQQQRQQQQDDEWRQQTEAWRQQLQQQADAF